MPGRTGGGPVLVPPGTGEGRCAFVAGPEPAGGPRTSPALCDEFQGAGEWPGIAGTGRPPGPRGGTSACAVGAEPTRTCRPAAGHSSHGALQQAMATGGEAGGGNGCERTCLRQSEPDVTPGRCMCCNCRACHTLAQVTPTRAKDSCEVDSNAFLLNFSEFRIFFFGFSCEQCYLLSSAGYR